MGCVYLLISPSKKCYIGITSQNFETRLKEHIQAAKEGRPYALHNAIRKYNIGTFESKIIFESNDWNILTQKEKDMIIEYNSLFPNGYNLTSGGDGTPGRIITDEQRKRMSEGQKKRFKDISQLQKLKESGLKGNKAQSEKAKKIIEEKLEKKKIYLNSDEYKKYRSQRIKDGMNKPESRIKLLEAAKKRSEDPNWRKKISETKRLKIKPI